jgi:arginase
MERRLVSRLFESGLDVDVRVVFPVQPQEGEIASILAICGAAAVLAAEGIAEGRTPLFLTGNCNHAALAARAALVRTGHARHAVVWLDAHADFDLPATTRTGFFDGMSLSVLTGYAYVGAAARRIEGFTPISPRSVALIGTHDLEPHQVRRLAASPVRWVPPRGLDGINRVLDDLSLTTDGAYLHIDLDVLDARFGRANRYAAEGGLTPAEVRLVIDAVADRLPLRAGALTAFDPATAADSDFSETVADLAAHLSSRLAAP